MWISLSAVAIDSAGTNVLLPALARDLAVSRADVTWVVTSYQFGLLATLLPFASLGATIGYRRVSQAGLLLYMLASIGCVASGSFGGLIVMRMIQGVGMAGMSSVNAALLRYIFPPRSLARAISYNALIIASLGTLGPTIASIMLTLASWHYLFLLIGLICFASFLLGVRSLPSNPRSGEFPHRHALLYTGAISLLFAAVAIWRWGHLMTPSIMLALFGLGLLVLLVELSSRAAQPLVPLDLLRSRLYAVSLATSIASFAAHTLAFISLPFVLLEALGKPQAAVGLLLASWPLGVLVAAPAAARLTGRIPTAFLAGAGLLAMGLGLAMTAALASDAADLDVAWRLGLCGLGFGFFQTPNNHLLISSAPLDRAGAAAGMQAIARSLGQYVGGATAALIFAWYPATTCLSLYVAAALATMSAMFSFSRRLIDRSAKSLPRGQGLTGASLPDMFD